MCNPLSVHIFSCFYTVYISLYSIYIFLYILYSLTLRYFMLLMPMSDSFCCNIANRGLYFLILSHLTLNIFLSTFYFLSLTGCGTRAPGSLTALPITTLLQRRSIRGRVLPLGVGWGRKEARRACGSHFPPQTLLVFSPPRTQRLPAAPRARTARTQHGLERRPRTGLSTLCTSEEDGGGDGHGLVFRGDILTKTRTEREESSLSLPVSLCTFFLFPYILFLLLLLLLLLPLFPRVWATQRDVCRTAVRRRGSGPVCQHAGRRFLLRWQVLGEWMNEWMNDVQLPGYYESLHLIRHL